MSSQQPGREILEELARKGGYVFHGSQVGTIEEFVPAKVQSQAEAHGKPIVYGDDEYYVFATKYIDVAIFAAVVWRRAGTSGWYTEVQDGIDPTFVFNASPEAVAAAKAAAGYVYVFSDEPFSPSRTTTAEVVSVRPVRPLHVIAVSAADVRPKIDTLQPDTNKHAISSL